MCKRILFLFLLGLLGPFSWTLFAQENQGGEQEPLLTLQEALGRGLESNFSLRSERLNLPIARYNEVSEEALFDPALAAGARAEEEKLPTSSPFSEDPYSQTLTTEANVGLEKTWRMGTQTRLSFNTLREWNNSSIEGLNPQYRSFLVFDLTQPLLRDFGTDANVASLDVARNTVRQSALGYLNSARSLGEQIEVAYYRLAWARSALDFRRESLQLARELEEGNRKKLEAGLIPISEVTEAQTAAASRLEELVAAKQQAEAALFALWDLLEVEQGLPGGVEAVRTMPLPEPTWELPELDAALEKALAGRADLESARLEIASRNIRLRYLANQTLPRLDLEATLGVNGLSGQEREVSFDFGGDGEVDGAIGRSVHRGDYPRSLDRMASADGYEWAAGLSFSYPLGNRAAEARRNVAALEKRQSVYQLKRLENAIATEIRDSVSSVLLGRQRVEVASELVDLARRTLGQEEERLRAGLSDTFRILSFQTDLIDARIRRVTALRDYNEGLAALYRAMAENLERHGVLAAVEE